MGIKSLFHGLFMIIAFISINVNAEAVYYYTGNNYNDIYTTPSIYDTSMSINGSFTVDSKLISVNGDISAQVISYGFSDGVNIYSDTDPEGSAQFLVNTDSAGNITNWNIDISDVDSQSPTVVPGDIISRIMSSYNDDVIDIYQCDFIVVGCIFSQIDGASIYNNPGSWSDAPPTTPVDISGTIKTASDADICAMVLASGQYMFSCDPMGEFSLADLPREKDGTVKRQIYADGFFPKIDILTGFSNDAMVMTRSGTCPGYNTPYDPAFVPGSAGKRINIAGKVLLQNSQTPICAMVLANGQHMFSCDGTGNYALNIPLDTNGQFKLQVYADGFAPTIQTFDEFKTTNNVRMARAVECQ